MPWFDANMPVPRITPDTRAFWAACRDRRLVVQRCTRCGEYRFAPAPICPECHGSDHENVESSGRGEVFTWTITHRPVHPAVRQALPFNVVVVRLDDCGGACIVSNLVGVPNEQIRAGLPVTVVWDPIDEEITLPRFRALPKETL
ncbi:Zn-ribbon domain-containing OB-fold protein [Pseudorhodoferax sp.]|uniref:Zn-ribbon domain-containing OB-fold protein n=1 Tax=Pseudorhodoferax sp. TaxID=1993553 RepID=UPI002DD696DC|nr:OB-fold domain-containing protein [Pseudorhodoferax sp.]